METSTIRIAIRGLNEPWDRSRIPAVLDEIEARFAKTPTFRRASPLTA